MVEIIGADGASRVTDLSAVSGAAAVPALQRLADAAAQVSGRSDRIAETASFRTRACVRRWQEWWLVHRADYTAYSGEARLTMLIDTQYARWTGRTCYPRFRHRLGRGTHRRQARNRAPRL